MINKDDVHLNLMMSKINIGALGYDNGRADKEAKELIKEPEDPKKSSSIFIMEANDCIQC